MVHPYLKSRERLRKGQEIRYESEALKPALERTLGVPIFQEQVMQIAMIAADFTRRRGRPPAPLHGRVEAPVAACTSSRTG